LLSAVQTSDEGRGSRRHQAAHRADLRIAGLCSLSAVQTSHDGRVVIKLRAALTSAYMHLEASDPRHR
jgi:hypothetical protein